jgi:putative endonuclease
MERRVKAGSHKKKLDLINTLNPDWRDLYDDLTG